MEYLKKIGKNAQIAFKKTNKIEHTKINKILEARN